MERNEMSDDSVYFDKNPEWGGSGLSGIFGKKGKNQTTGYPSPVLNVSQKPAYADTDIPRDDVEIDVGYGVDNNSQSIILLFNESGTGQQGISGECRSKSLEIFKCIIHGGIRGFIASLSVVSFAAASDATTLNIIALGVASLISCLFVFGHSLLDLKNENANQETERYQELLGRRGHFLFHATFAIVSFLVFGIIPPVVYGFAFSENDNKDYKILAVAASSFACVCALAIGKAYTRRSPRFYVRTILYFITMAISVSGVAYGAGYLIKMLIDRLGWFEPNQTGPSFVPDAISATPTWASY